MLLHLQVDLALRRLGGLLVAELVGLLQLLRARLDGGGRVIRAGGLQPLHLRAQRGDGATVRQVAGVGQGLGAHALGGTPRRRGGRVLAATALVKQPSNDQRGIYGQLVGDSADLVSCQRGRFSVDR